MRVVDDVVERVDSQFCASERYWNRRLRPGEAAFDGVGQPGRGELGERDDLAEPPFLEALGADALLVAWAGTGDEHSAAPIRSQVADRVVAGHRNDAVGEGDVCTQVGLNATDGDSMALAESREPLMFIVRKQRPADG